MFDLYMILVYSFLSLDMYHCIYI